MFPNLSVCLYFRHADAKICPQQVLGGQQEEHVCHPGKVRGCLLFEVTSTRRMYVYFRLSNHRRVRVLRCCNRQTSTFSHFSVKFQQFITLSMKLTAVVGSISDQLQVVFLYVIPKVCCIVFRLYENEEGIQKRHSGVELTMSRPDDDSNLNLSCKLKHCMNDYRLHTVDVKLCLVHRI